MQVKVSQKGHEQVHVSGCLTLSDGAGKGGRHRRGKRDAAAPLRTSSPSATIPPHSSFGGAIFSVFGGPRGLGGCLEVSHS